jgi:hypothetical protein
VSCTACLIRFSHSSPTGADSSTRAGDGSAGSVGIAASQAEDQARASGAAADTMDPCSVMHL